MKKILFLFLFLFFSLNGASAATPPDPADNFAYYALEDLSDSTPNNYDLTNSGATSGVSGIIDNAYSFDGVNDYLAMPRIISMESASQLTISMWVQNDVLTSMPNDYIFGSGSGSGISMFLLGGFNRLYLEPSGSTNRGYWNDYSGVMNSNSAFYHVVFVFDGTATGNSNRLKLYVEGVERTLTYEGTIGTTTSSATGSPKIGSQQTGSSPWDGIIDEVSLFDVALTSDEVAYLYASGSPGSSQQYPFPVNSFTHNITGGYLTPNASVYTDASNLRGNIFVNSTADVYVNYSYLVNGVEVVTGLYTGSPVGNSFVLPVLSNTNFQQEDVVNFTAVLVNQSNTSLEVSPVFSSNGVTIINRVPTGDIEWSTRTPLNDSNFSAFVTPGDSDLDHINISWNLFKNGVLDSSGTELNVAYPYGTIKLFVVDASTTLPGDNYTFNVSIHDGFDTYVSGQSLVAMVTDSTDFTITVNDEWSGTGINNYNITFTTPVSVSNPYMNATCGAFDCYIYTLPDTTYYNNSMINYSWAYDNNTRIKIGYIQPSPSDPYAFFYVTENNESFNGSLSQNTITIKNNSEALTLYYNISVIQANQSTYITLIQSNETRDITLSSSTHFSKNFTNWNLSENLFAELNQSRISFAATALTSNTTINNVSFTISGITREVFPLSVGSYTVSASNANWSGSKSFSVSALDIKTEIVPVSDTTLILGVSNHLTGNFQPGTKTGWYYNALYDKNYSFSFDADTTNISLEKGLTYEFYLDVPPGFATNAGVAFNYTPSTNVANRNFTLFEPKTLEVFLFNTDAEVLTNETTIRVENNAVAYQTTTSTGSHYFDDILVGNYTVTITSNGFNTAYRFVSIGSNDYTAINVFLSQGGKTVSFNVIDNLGNPVDQAIIGLSYFVNGTQVFIGQRQTDLSGGAQMIVNENITYVVTASKQGYKTFSGSLTPFQNNYIINLDSDALNSFESVFTDVSYRTNFVSKNNQSWALATFDVVSASGSISSLSMTATYASTNYFINSVNNPNGANLFLNITDINRSEENEIIVTYQITSNNGEIISWNETYLVQGNFEEENLLSIDLKTLPAGLKVFISAVIIALIAILSTVLSGRMIGGAIGGILGVAITIVLNLLTLIPGLLTIGVLFVLIITDIRTGENR